MNEHLARVKFDIHTGIQFLEWIQIRATNAQGGCNQHVRMQSLRLISTACNYRMP